MSRWLCIVLCCCLNSQVWGQSRVVSINMCADELLLRLALPETIISLSYLSSDPQYSRWVEQANAYPKNFARAEEIVSMQPDLVLAGQYSDPMVLRLLNQQGIRVVQLERPSQLSGLFDNVLSVGAILGQQTKAEALVEQWRKDIEGFRVQGDEGKRPSLVLIGPNGFTEGRGSLRDQVLQLAGIDNVAAELGIKGNGELTLEQILAQQPDLIAVEDASQNHHSLAQRILQHPVIDQLTATRVTLPANLWTCPGPSYVEALTMLNKAKQQWQLTQERKSES